MGVKLTCTKCLENNDAGLRYCVSCGNSLSVPAEKPSPRRHDIDAIRSIALILLILYHISVGFQPWGTYIGFITNKESLEWLWSLMKLINIWRIPILFVVSGMGVYFAMQRRTWGELIGDRALRIVVPLVFGTFFIVPIYMVLFNAFYDKPLIYIPNPGHLWFLFNICIYIIIMLPIFIYIKENPQNKALNMISTVISKPLGVVVIFAIPMAIEALLVNPDDYPAFHMWSSTPFHGLLLGMICFFLGFIFVSLKTTFWSAVDQSKNIALILAISLFSVRIMELIDIQLIRNPLTSLESVCWILTAFGFGSTYLNKSTRIIRYLSSAVYPVYIVHMPIQFFFSSLIFPLAVPATIKFIMVLIATYSGSLIIFEMVKQLKIVRVAMGIKI